MKLRVMHFVAIILTALALIPSGAHVLELPNKIGLDRDHYMTVQHIYNGWALTGFVLIAAIIANLIVAIALRRHKRQAHCAAAAAGFIALGLAIFFTWTFPANQATSNWTVAPADWFNLRQQWEYAHAANGVANLLALCSAVLSALLVLR